MKIEIVQIGEQHDFLDHIEKLQINGIIDETSIVEGGILTIEAKESFDKIASFSCKELSEYFISVYFTYKEEWSEYPIRICIDL